MGFFSSREHSKELAALRSQVAAIGKSMGMIEFNMDGTVIQANPNFLSVIGYTMDEVGGGHHRMFVDSLHANCNEYRAFWEKVNRSEYETGEYKRITKNGSEIWIQASYNPIFDPNGKPYKVVKYAADITAHKKYQLEVEAVLKKTRRVMELIAKGDLTETMEGQFTGEFAILRDVVVRTIDNLREIIGRISEAVELITNASGEIAAGNSNLSQSTEEQALSLIPCAGRLRRLFLGRRPATMTGSGKSSELAAQAI